ncbi:hypothetical protein HUK80_01195 [Flavobacterium sp. MAH-1]|uniref:Tetratricopeptide repeat-containing protein n=1 Tax=Flavobacterium agri TaxID=2743471 RepID=A0A7Y8XYY1_9FLAO|nr:hypothetical protein [Flavobacterium agri]NUY79494.1 hypothetical protein [Flavobacterium agri]NYA69519.1 hypothetical protein [Flavobacterium agri]
MKRIFLLAVLLVASATYCQTDAELCQQAQTAYQQNNFNDAIKLAGRALAKNPDAPCRRVRIDAAMRDNESSVNYLMAISDLDYLLAKGDKSEPNYKNLGNAEAGLAKMHFDNQNFAEASKHYQKAKNAYTSAKGISGTTDYDAPIANADNQMKQATAQKK